MSALIPGTKKLRMTDLPILYSFRRCPYAMRARMAIAVSGTKVELREVVLRDKPPELLDASPKATVPVLVLPDRRVIDESLDVMHWALRQHDPKNWFAGNDPALIAANDGPFKHALDRYKYPHRYALEDSSPFRAAGLAWLEELEDRLTSGTYLSDAEPGLADIAIFPFIRQFAATDRTWFDEQAIPKVQTWLDKLTASELFNSVMVRYPQWRAGDVGIDFPG